MRQVGVGVVTANAGRRTLRLGVFALAAVAASVCRPAPAVRQPSRAGSRRRRLERAVPIDAAQAPLCSSANRYRWHDRHRIHARREALRHQLSRLYRVDVGTGRATPIGAGVGMGTVNALASDARGHLYVASLDGRLGLLDIATGRATLAARTGAGSDRGDLAFAPDGRLLRRRRCPVARCCQGQPATGIATVRVPLSEGRLRPCIRPRRQARRSADGNSASPVLVSIDPATGRSKAIGRKPNVKAVGAREPSEPSSTTPAPTGCSKAAASQLVEQNRPQPLRLCRTRSGRSSAARSPAPEARRWRSRRRTHLLGNPALGGVHVRAAPGSSSSSRPHSWCRPSPPSAPASARRQPSSVPATDGASRAAGRGRASGAGTGHASSRRVDAGEPWDAADRDRAERATTSRRPPATSCA